MLKAILAVLGLILLFFFLPLISVIVGAFCGWIVGIFWPTTFSAVLAHFGLSAFAPYQVGAALGFVAGFFKSISTKS